MRDMGKRTTSYEPLPTHKIPSFDLLDRATVPCYTRGSTNVEPEKGNTMAAPAYNLGLFTISGERLL
jgi:hypothetical protein